MYAMPGPCEPGSGLSEEAALAGGEAVSDPGGLFAGLGR